MEEQEDIRQEHTEVVSEEPVEPDEEGTAAVSPEESAEGDERPVTEETSERKEEDEQVEAREHAVEEESGEMEGDEGEYMPRLKEEYLHVVIPEMRKRFGYTNRMQVPAVRKVVVNMGVGEGASSPKAVESAMGDLAMVTGQQPVVTRARRSVAGFKLRAGMTIGCKVTLRGNRMYEFMDRLFSTALPRVRDFRGLPLSSFDGNGNYTLGVEEQLIFPEIDYDDIDKVRGMDITIVTTAATDEEAQFLLKGLGMPIRDS